MTNKKIESLNDKVWSLFLEFIQTTSIPSPSKKNVAAARYILEKMGPIYGDDGEPKTENAIACKLKWMSKNNWDINNEPPQPVSAIETNKKMPEKGINWRDFAKAAMQMQEFKERISNSQDHGVFKFLNIDEPIIIMGYSDQHMGSYGTNHGAFIKHTEEILSTPNLYCFLLGDPAQMSIKLRNVAEISDNVLTPSMQLEMFASWIDEIQSKVIAAVWDNHTVMREEAVTGFSVFKKLMRDRVIYHDHIGHTDIYLNGIKYKIAVSHKFNGRSYLNRTHGQQRYARFEGQDRDIVLAGDSHQWGISQYHDGPTERVAINAGTLQTNSGYAKRHFSLFTIPYMPCIVLHPDVKKFVPFRNLDEAMMYCEGYKSMRNASKK